MQGIRSLLGNFWTCFTILVVIIKTVICCRKVSILLTIYNPTSAWIFHSCFCPPGTELFTVRAFPRRLFNIQALDGVSQWWFMSSYLLRQRSKPIFVLIFDVLLVMAVFQHFLPKFLVDGLCNTRSQADNSRQNLKLHSAQLHCWEFFRALRES